MVTLISGVGSRGQVGEAVAAALSARGDTLLLVSRNEADVSARATELGGAARNVYAYGCDLADPHAVEDLRQRIGAEHGGRLDALVNLAGGFAASGPLAESDWATLQRLLQINLSTAYLATRAFLPQLRAARGSVVFFASEAVLEGARTSGIAAYAASKAAVVGLMRSVAEEGRPDGVRANAVAPASIRTASNEAEMAADTRYVERAEVASLVAFLCSPAAAAITGQIIRLRK